MRLGVHMPLFACASLRLLLTLHWLLCCRRTRARKKSAAQTKPLRQRYVVAFCPKETQRGVPSCFVVTFSLACSAALLAEQVASSETLQSEPDGEVRPQTAEKVLLTDRLPVDDLIAKAGCAP
eukprot:COSAG06_NODE_34192_length_478_cov_0.870712_1_plen_122_part_01